MLKHVSTTTAGTTGVGTNKLYPIDTTKLDTISLNSSSSSGTGSSTGVGGGGSSNNSETNSPYSMMLPHHHDSSLDESNLSSNESVILAASSRSSSMLSLPGYGGSPGPMSSSSATSGTKVVVKIFTRVLCTDVEYKTLSVYNHTTCKEIVQIILKKFRLQHRDANLFYLTLETWIQQTGKLARMSRIHYNFRRPGIPIRSMMTLEDDAYPALLQSCYRQKDLKFTLMMRRGNNVKIYHHFNHNSDQTPPFVNILISDRTTAQEVIALVLNILEQPTAATQHHGGFDLYEYSPTCKRMASIDTNINANDGIIVERKLSPAELPLAIQMEWPCRDYNIFQLRPSPLISASVPAINTSTGTANMVDHFKRNLKTEFALQLNHHQNHAHRHHHHHHHPNEKVLYI